jgi:Iron-containing redox enzyme
MDVSFLVDTFEAEGRLLDATLRHHPAFRALYTRELRGTQPALLRESYLRLLKLKADYVQYTVPALRAAGEALRDGDEEDRAWSAVFLGYASGETDQEGDYGHHVWAHSDMRALGASESEISAPPHFTALHYRDYFVESARLHPYGILGAKGVLEHFSIRTSDDLVKGVLESGIPNAEKAVSFFEHHGVLDIDHVREGDRNLERLRGAEKRAQILDGAYFTSGIYRAFVHYLVPV